MERIFKIRFCALSKMSTTVANVYGSNVVRLAIEQFGSNRSECVLTTPLLADASKYLVQLESLFISSDIPIFPVDTPVFKIYDTTLETLHFQCNVGPVYNWLDFAFQLQLEMERIAFLDASTLELDGSLLGQKIMVFKGNVFFWDDYMIKFDFPFDNIFETRNGELWMRTSQATGLIITSHRSPATMLEGGVWNPLFDNELGAFAPAILDDYVLSTKSRMDLFDNRHHIRIDSVLPLPHELFGVGKSKNASVDISNRYTFFEFDFPREVMTNTISVVGSKTSDNTKISQQLHTGIMSLVRPSPHSGLKKMLPGQTQDHRYEIFIIRKRFTADGSVELKEEPWPMSSADFFRMSLLFTQEV